MSQELEKIDTQEITDFLEGLHSYMEDEEVTDLGIKVEDIQEERFKIETKEQANFFIKKMTELRQQQEEINRLADAEINKTKERVERWREKELNSLNYQETYFTGLLQEFASKELESSGGKKKSVSLPHGSLAFRAQQPKYEYDDKVLLDYLVDNKKEDFITRKPAINKTELKKTAAVVNGKLYVGDEEIPGVTVTPQDPKFEVKI